MNKKIITILIFCIFEFFTSLSASSRFQTYAVTSTPSATPSMQLEEKIKTLVKENLETTEGLVQKEVVAKSLLGYSGTVKSVGTKNITLEIDKDLLQIAVLPTTIITKAGAEIKTSALALGDKLIVIGSKSKDASIEAKIINVIPEVDEKTLVITKAEVAIISKIDLKKKTFSLNIKGQDVAFTLSKKTTVKLENFTDGDQILAITKKYQGKYSLSRAIKI
jgi:hypothetical protein